METLPFEFHSIDTIPRIFPGMNGVERTPCFAFDSAQEVKLQVVGFNDVLTGQSEFFAVARGRDKEWSDQDQEFFFLTLLSRVAEKRSKVRKIA